MNDTNFDKILKQKLDEIPVPDEQASWLNMQQKLKQEKPSGNRYKWLLALLLLISGCGAFLLFRPGTGNQSGKEFSAKENHVYGKKGSNISKEEALFDEQLPLAATTTTKEKSNSQILVAAEESGTQRDIKKISQSVAEPTENKNRQPVAGMPVKFKRKINFKNSVDAEITNRDKPDNKQNSIKRKIGNASNGSAKKESISIQSEISIPSKTKYRNRKQRVKQQSDAIAKTSIAAGEIGENIIKDTEKATAENNNSTLPELEQKSMGLKDTVSTATGDSLSVSNNDPQKKIKQDSTLLKKYADKKGKHKGLIWSAGIGLQQSIAIGKQKSSGLNFNSKPGTLTDYLPSIYLRAEPHSRKWFVQAEFEAIAPTPVEPVVYSQQTNIDYFNNDVEVTKQQLKKLYYHTLYLGANIRLGRGFSAGLGFRQQWLFRSVSEKTVSHTPISSGNAEHSSNYQHSASSDSFFYNSIPSWTLQLNYEYRKWNAGLRFSIDTSPYIKFTLPDGQIEDRRNHLLQLYIRYRLWQSKK
ncbi:MAG: hypothetical protein JST02_12685 [Bacteroidetes bacterium]|nr:hypothetical protein [Bacteroidota bacterium]